MSLAIPADELEKIREHARRAYPHECCGVMFGRESDGRKVTSEVRALENVQESGKARTWDAGESARRRFEISADDFRACDRYARENKIDILGFYHSHPDHPARPSQHDLDRAWPWFSYVIVSVNRGEPKDVTSWEMAEDRSRFDAETLAVTAGAKSASDEHR